MLPLVKKPRGRKGTEEGSSDRKGRRTVPATRNEETEACRNHHNKKKRKKGKERASGEARQGGRGVRESAESMTPNRN